MIVEVLKRCTKCKQDKPFTRFHLHPTGQYGVISTCRECRQTYNRRRWQDDLLVQAKSAASRYGVSADDILAYWQVPNCQCCGAELTEKNRRIDHCHDKGHVRGVVCHLCNMACAGEHRDCIARLQNAVFYLQRDLERHEQG